MNDKERTTKEILTEKSSARERTPLYNPAALEIMRKEFAGWMQSAVREKDRASWMKTPRTVLGSDIPREMLYTADEVFVTGTAAEVTPIRSVDKLKVGEGGRGPITRKLQERYLATARGEAGGDRHGWLTPVPSPVAAAR